MASTLFVFLTFTTTCFLFSCTTSADNGFRENPCRGSFYEDYCMETIGKDPEFVACEMDQWCMAKVAVKRATQNSTDTQRKVEEMLYKTIPAPRANWVKPLKTCVDIYGGITHFLNDLLQQLNSDNIPNILFHPSTEKCSAAFPGGRDASPLRNMDTSLGINLEIAVEFCDLIED